MAAVQATVPLRPRDSKKVICISPAAPSSDASARREYTRIDASH